MGFNIYKQIPKIKEYLKKQGYNSKNIPVDVFGSTLMFIFGMKQETAIEWMDNFEKINLIKIDQGMVSFTGGDE